MHSAPAVAPAAPPAAQTQLLLLIGLSNLGIAQPIYQQLSRGADFFVAHQTEQLDLFLLVLTLSVGLAVSLFGFVRLVARLHAASGFRLWRACLLLCLTLLFLTALNQVDSLPPGLQLASSLTLAIIGLWLFERSSKARTFALFLSAVACATPFLFLLRPEIRQFWWAEATAPESATSVDSEVPVVLVVFDELPLSSLQKPNHDLDALRFPNFAALAQTAHWYRRATSVAESTRYAVPAIVTGTRPQKTASANVASYPSNLFTWLGRSYRVNAWQNYTRLCPVEICSNDDRFSLGERLSLLGEDLTMLYAHLAVPPGWRDRLPDVDQHWSGFRRKSRGIDRQAEPREVPNAHDVPAFLASFLANMKRHEAPSLHYFHPNLPHVPWRYLPNGQEYGPIGHNKVLGLEGNTWTEDDWAVIQGYQRHLLQVSYSDRVLGTILARLRSQKLFEKALVIVTADHGISFLPGENRRIVNERHPEDILEVPLLVKLPRQSSGSVVDRRVELIDIIPTIAEVLEAAPPWTVEGISLLDSAPRRPAYTTRAFEKLPVRSDERRRQAGLDRKAALFGTGDIAELFKIGRKALLGSQVAPLAVAPSQWRVEISDSWMFEAFTPTSGFVPRRLFGTLTNDRPGQPETPRELAISVNGKIVATTFTSQTRGRRFLSAMLPPNTLREGSNRVQVHSITDLPGQPLQLAALGTRDDEPAILVLRSGRAASIEMANGSSTPIAYGQVKGRFIHENSFFRGDAFDSVDLRPIEMLHVFVDGRSVFSGAPERLSTPDLVRKHDAPLLHFAGYRVWLPDSILPKGARVRVLAQIGDIASELNTTWLRPSLDVGRRVEYAIGDAGEILVGAAGTLEIEDRTCLGEIDLLIRVGRRMRIGGWALDRHTHRPLTDVIVFFDGKANHPSVVRSIRRQLRLPYGDDAVPSGFLFDFAKASLEAKPPPEIRVFAVSRGGAACELGHGGDNPAALRAGLGLALN